MIFICIVLEFQTYYCSYETYFHIFTIVTLYLDIYPLLS